MVWSQRKENDNRLAGLSKMQGGQMVMDVLESMAAAYLAHRFVMWKRFVVRQRSS